MPRKHFLVIVVPGMVSGIVHYALRDSGDARWIAAAVLVGMFYILEGINRIIELLEKK